MPRLAGKIVTPLRKKNVRDHRRICDDRLAEVLEIRREEARAGHQKHYGHHDGSSRQQSLCPPCEEMPKCELSASQIAENDGADEIAGNHEKHVNADESAWQKVGV